MNGYVLIITPLGPRSAHSWHIFSLLSFSTCFIPLIKNRREKKKRKNGLKRGKKTLKIDFAIYYKTKKK